MTKKKSAILLLAVMIAVCGALTVAAWACTGVTVSEPSPEIAEQPTTEMTAPDPEIQPLRYEYCDECGTGRVTKESEQFTTAWIHVKWQSCVHGHSNAQDRVVKKEVYNVYSCDSCSYSYKDLSDVLYDVWCEAE